MEMDPTSFAGYYSARPFLGPGMRYPYPATTAAGAAGRGMIFYPQPMSVESLESMDQELDLDHPDQAGSPRLGIFLFSQIHKLASL